MNSIKIFNNAEFGLIRTIEENGKVLFCGSDVAKALGYAKPNNAINQHCKGDTLKQGIIDSLGREQNATFITEGDIYRLIINSKLPTAEKFEKWVFEEILPSIRKNGGYIANQENSTPEQILANAILVANNIIENQNTQLEQQKPLVKFAEKVSQSQNSISVGQFAKLLHDRDLRIGQNNLFIWLRDNKYLMKNNEPYQRYIKQGLFEVIEQTYETNHGIKTRTKTLITGKGQIYFANKLIKE